MKKKLVLLAAGLGMLASMNAQWNINGDNSSTGNLNLGSSIDLYNGGIIYGRSSTPNYRAWIEPYNTTTGHMKFWNEFGAGDIIFGTVNAERLRITASGNIGIGTGATTLYQQLSITGGIGFANQNSADKKLYSPVDGILEWYTHDYAGEHGFTVSHQGERKVYLNTNGNSYFIGGYLGIGTTSPNANLEIKGQGSNVGLIIRHQNEIHDGWGLMLSQKENLSGSIACPGYDLTIEGGWNKKLILGNVEYNNHGGQVIFPGGNVGIGIASPSYKLDVNGTIHAREVKVDLTGWSDFVFHPTFKLKSLTEVEQYIQTNGHLENIPSAKEVEQNGVNVGDMQAKLLQKVEELTLYSIEQDKAKAKLEVKVEDQAKKNFELEQKLADQAKEIEQLKQLITQKLK